VISAVDGFAGGRYLLKDSCCVY